MFPTCSALPLRLPSSLLHCSPRSLHACSCLKQNKTTTRHIHLPAQRRSESSQFDCTAPFRLHSPVSNLWSTNLQKCWRVFTVDHQEIAALLVSCGILSKVTEESRLAINFEYEGVAYLASLHFIK